MPIYEYGCEACGNEFELMQKVGAEAPQCPKCAAATQKRISRTSFQLKGGGWYKDGYSGKSNQKSESTSSEPAASASSTATPAPAPKADSSTTSSTP